MRLATALALTAALVTGLDRAAAQDKDLLPMSFVRVDSATMRKLESDWMRMHEAGREWAYCVTGWKVSQTQDADTIYVITALQRADVKSQRHELAEFTCVGPGGLSMPIAHAHPGGDCSPSRADATYAVAHGTPFALILCGPRATAGYTGQQFVWISRGALTERNAVIAGDSRP